MDKVKRLVWESQAFGDVVFHKLDIVRNVITLNWHEVHTLRTSVQEVVGKALISMPTIHSALGNS